MPTLWTAESIEICPDPCLHCSPVHPICYFYYSHRSPQLYLMLHHSQYIQTLGNVVSLYHHWITLHKFGTQPSFDQSRSCLPAIFTMSKLSTIWSDLLVKLAYIEQYRVGRLLSSLTWRVVMMIKRRSKKKKMSFYQQKQARSAECLLTITEEAPRQHGRSIV